MANQQSIHHHQSHLLGINNIWQTRSLLFNAHHNLQQSEAASSYSTHSSNGHWGYEWKNKVPRLLLNSTTSSSSSSFPCFPTWIRPSMSAHLQGYLFHMLCSQNTHEKGVNPVIRNLNHLFIRRWSNGANYRLRRTQMSCLNSHLRTGYPRTPDSSSLEICIWAMVGLYQKCAVHVLMEDH